MSRNCFEFIWQAWHFIDNSQQTQDAGRLFKMWPVYRYFLQKFRSVCSPKQELSLDETGIPWQGHLKFQTYKPGRITKCWALVRMVCEAVLVYICNMEIHAAEGKKLEDTVLSLLEQNLRQNHHICQDDFYNSVTLAETLLDTKVRVCGTMRANGHSTWPRTWNQTVEKRAIIILKEGWRRVPSVEGWKTCANDKHNPRINSWGQTSTSVITKFWGKLSNDRKGWYCVRWTVHCSVHFFFVQNTKHKEKKYKSFLHEVGRSWISKVQNTTMPSSD
jgi:hypothetical protein